MASPQKENGYTAIANEIMDALCRIRIPGEEMQVLNVILRKTYGWGKCEDAISLSQFADMTGIKKPNIIGAIKGLLSKKIIIVMGKDNDSVKVYKFNKDYDQWKPLSKKITLSKKIKNVMEKDNTSLSKKIPTKETNTKTKKQIPLVSEIFDAWNSLGLIKHTDIKKHDPSIRTALKHNARDDIIRAMNNYADVYHDPECYWSHKWQLKDFINRGLDRFLPINFKKSDYRRTTNNGKQTTYSDRRNWRGETVSAQSIDGIEQYIAEAERAKSTAARGAQRAAEGDDVPDFADI